MDAVVGLDSGIKKAIVNKEAAGAVFLDIEEAWDGLWKEGLLIALHDAGIGGRTFNWIKKFLTQAMVGSKFSEELENGAPQGSVISPLLFNIPVNGVFSRVGKEFRFPLFADDGAIWKQGRNLSYIYGQTQATLDKVSKRALKYLTHDIWT